MIARMRAKVNDGLTVSLTQRVRALGLPERRAARTDIQRQHELALAWPRVYGGLPELRQATRFGVAMRLLV